MNNRKIRVSVTEMLEMLDACNIMLNRKLPEKLAEAIVQTKISLLTVKKEVQALKDYTEEKFFDAPLVRDERLKNILDSERTILVTDLILDDIKRLEFMPEKAKTLIEKLFRTEGEINGR